MPETAAAAMPRERRTATLEDVWALFDEVGVMHQEVAKSQKETAAQMQETDRKLQETDRLVQEATAQVKETSAYMKKTAKQIKALHDEMGGVQNSFGELAEHLVAPNIAAKFNLLGHNFDSVNPGGKKILDEKGNVLAQIDLLLENGESVLAVEIKSKPNKEDIAKHFVRLEKLRCYMDKHHDKRVILGALAGAIFYEWIKKAAIEAGLYVIVQSGDTMQIETPQGFTPKQW
jgi:hypothetical protein